jgi:hypothetical protein
MRFATTILALAVAAAAAGCAPAIAAEPGLRLENQDGQRVAPLEPGDDVRVFVFVRRDCPISNRYAPELERLRRQFAESPDASSKSVRFWLVYVDPHDTPAAVAEHQREYGLHFAWLLDPRHDLATAAGATVTPEALVYAASASGSRALAYRGRIDDRVVDFSHVRPVATSADLRDAIAAVRAGRAPAAASLPAVGCFIADLQ